MRLKHLRLTVVIAAAFLAGTLVPTATTQPTPSAQYVVVDYMKVEPGKGSDYVGMERELFKPIHQERVKNGNISSWSLYAVRFPGGTAKEYDYLTFAVFDKFQNLENPYSGVDVTKIHPNLTAAEIAARVNAARRLVRSEVWTLVDRTAPR